jgi:hypothetical protein
MPEEWILTGCQKQPYAAAAAAALRQLVRQLHLQLAAAQPC